MDHESNSKAEFLSLAEELRFYILSFLPCRDILRCASVCKALRHTYMSSSELQYIVELSGQRLLPVPDVDDHTPISERLQLLRDKAHAWFKVHLHSFETVSLSKEMRFAQINVTDGHLYTWDVREDVAAIIPILPKPSQQSVQRDRWQRTLSSIISVPHSVKLDVFMDLAQNLIAVLYLVDEALYIDLGALDGDGIHPQAAGRRLSLAMPPGSEDCSNYLWSVKMKCFGRHIALRWGSRLKVMWLQIWDWQDSTTSNCFLNDDNNIYPNEFCFLGNNRFLVLADELNLYSIEDMSQMPQLLARFSIPISLQYTSLHPVNDNEYSSQPQMQIQQTVYISDPKHWLLHMTIHLGKSPVFVISTRVFHDLDELAVVDLKPIPWTRWGPSNTRIFERTWASKVQLCGNRVFRAIPVDTLDSGPSGYRLHMMDFSPLAVTNRRGLGRVVKESSTTDISELSGRPEESLTTSLPYVEVVSDRVFDACYLNDIWIDNDRIYLAQMIQNFEGSYYSTLEVIGV
ncbi:hypothetical protein DEU56DRAFT_756910 [Suillus clintonianus]|uniref:uncharacterized protein n=1 Tax=Suillus clintonianus TaxID=1904413 RepID=UPI001B863FF5|nr:uncharacterized protein DEU56DRAFT_756910 [Suillus clintonianus]KAG2134474.1 hypothetical protein DEU56DRAFT_756910 [Suillus clintonianus]